MFVKVHVTPDARKESIEEKDETLYISVREPAQGNMANTRVREIIALRFHKQIGHVRILTGHRSRVKMVSISG